MLSSLTVSAELFRIFSNTERRPKVSLGLPDVN
jgi:hypothetical protein